MIFHKLKNYFFTYHMRPKSADSVHAWSDELKEEPKTALVIQGQLILDKHFTLETIKLYKKIFSKAIIILSTWEGEDADELEKIRREGIEVLLNKKPAFKGQQNINLQIVSSLAGIKKAEEMGATYALKIRTDQRMYALNALDFLRSILEVFPVKDTSIQKKRIVGVSLNTYKYRPHGLSDMTIFGIIEDILLYWSAPLDDRTIPAQDLTGSTGTFANARVCEIYLSTEFQKKLGREPKMTLEDSWMAYSNYFCVVDQQSLNIYWYKNPHREYKDVQYEYVRNNQPLTFLEWLNMYHNPSNKAAIPEKTLETIFTSVISQ